MCPECYDDIHSTLTTGSNTITIQHCSQSGVWANNTTTAIHNVLCDDASNSTFQNGGITVSGASSAPQISRCKVVDSYYGIKIASTASNPMACVDSCHVQINDQHSIEVNTNCRVNLNGYNNIYFRSGKKALNNPSSGSIDAQYNYWGTSDDPPAWSTIISFTDVVTKTNYVTSEYDSTSVAGVYKRAIIAESQDKSPYEIADELESSGDWIVALEIYNDLIATEKDTGNKKYIILSLLRICDNYSHDYSDLRSLITYELETARSWYRASLDFILCELLLREGKPEEAKNAFLQKVESYKNTPMEVEMFVRVAEIYGDYLNDKKNANIFAERAASINPGQETLRFAYSAADMNYYPSQYENKFKGKIDYYKTQPETEKDTVIEKHKQFVSITPNPANPATTITYSIAEPSNVKLVIYSVSGQKVSTLVDGHITAGKHAATFDGSELASGVYFYSFESKGFTKTGKMLLIK